MAECKTVAIEIAPLCTVVIPMLIHRGNHSTQRHDFDSDCPALSHRNEKDSIVKYCRKKGNNIDPIPGSNIFFNEAYLQSSFIILKGRSRRKKNRKGP